jgi:transcriptional regulator with XRE-family HTH domain
VVIRQRREAKGWSQQKLAEKATSRSDTCPSSKQALSRIPAFEKLERFAKALGVPVTALSE